MGCCGDGAGAKRVCADAKRYVEKQLEGPPKKAVVACEGACIKGEVARTAANLLAYRLERERAVRICLGDAATADSGMLALVQRAPEVIVVEGCPLACGTAILRTRAPELAPSIVDASKLYDYDRARCFEILDLPREELDAHATKVAAHVRVQHFAARAERVRG